MIQYKIILGKIKLKQQIYLNLNRVSFQPTDMTFVVRCTKTAELVSLETWMQDGCGPRTEPITFGADQESFSFSLTLQNWKFSDILVNFWGNKRRKYQTYVG